MERINYWLDHNLKNYKKKGNSITIDEELHVVDWLKSDDAIRHRKRIERLSVPDAIMLSLKWTYKLNKLLCTVETDDDILVVHTFDGGSKIVQLMTLNAFNLEGTAMRHCIKTRFSQNNTVLSYRTKENKSICTIEIGINEIIELQGFANGSVPLGYQDDICNYLIENYSILLLKTKLNYLFKIGLIKDESSAQFYKLNNLSEPVIFYSDLNLRNLKLKSIPDKIICYGRLDLSDNEIETIPEGFIQNGSLNLSGNKIKEIPSGYQSTCFLNLSHNKIKEIPVDLNVNNLDLSYNKIKEIPAGLRQCGILNLSHNKIKEVPAGFIDLRYKLNLSSNLIEELPVITGVDFDCYKSKVNNNKKIQWDFSKNPINKIPDNYSHVVIISHDDGNFYEGLVITDYIPPDSRLKADKVCFFWSRPGRCAIDPKYYTKNSYLKKKYNL